MGNTLRPGARVALRGHEHDFGTLSLVVRDTSGAELMLSAAHVLGALACGYSGTPQCRHTATKEVVLCPASLRPAQWIVQRVGTVVRSRPRSWTQQTNLPLEAALVQPLDQVDVSGKTGLRVPRMGQTLRGDYYTVDEDLTGLPVYGFGGTSGLMSGRITVCGVAPRLGVPVDRTRATTVEGCYEVEGEGETGYFAHPGDSGAPVCDHFGRVIGIVIGRSTDSATRHRMTYVEPIGPILDAFEVELVGPKH